MNGEKQTAINWLNIKDETPKQGDEVIIKVGEQARIAIYGGQSPQEVALVFGLTLIDCIQHVFDELRSYTMTNNQPVKLLTLQEAKFLTLQEALEAVLNNKTVEVWTETDNTWQVFTAQRFSPKELLADEVKFRLAQITGKKTLADLKYTEIENEGVMIIALNSDDETIFVHRLTACELNPDYMTTDRLYEILEQRLQKSDVTNYHGCLEDFVIGFVMTRVQGV